METNKETCVIIGAMPVSSRSAAVIPPGAFVIAADAGWRQADRFEIVPDMVVGDFDTAPPPAQAAEILHLPAEKDDTDCFYAVRMALQRGFKRLILLGAFGGRADHSLANLQTLLYAAKQGATVLLVGEQLEIHCVGPGRHEIQAASHCYLSLFAAGGLAKGVTLGGVKYPLADAVLTPDYPLGISNEFISEKAIVECIEGHLYIMIVGKDN